MADGYNLYYSIWRFVQQILHGEAKYLWYDLFALAEPHLKEDEVIDKLYYCSAVYEANEKFSSASINDQREVQKIYMNYHIEKYGDKFSSLMGKFSRSSDDLLFCPRCDGELSYKGVYKEKQTDVNIALKVAESLCTRSHSKVILASGDTDYEPLFTYAVDGPVDLLRILPPSPHAKFNYNVGYITGEDVQNACFADQLPPTAPAPRRYAHGE